MYSLSAFTVSTRLWWWLQEGCVPSICSLLSNFGLCMHYPCPFLMLASASLLNREFLRTLVSWHWRPVWSMRSWPLKQMHWWRQHQPQRYGSEGHKITRSQDPYRKETCRKGGRERGEGKENMCTRHEKPECTKRKAKPKQRELDRGKRSTNIQRLGKQRG